MTTRKPGQRGLFADADDTPDEPNRLAEGSVTERLEWRDYQVLIKYSEPTYASHSGGKPRIYRWTYRFTALNATQARELAMKDFRDTERQSSVGWARDIVDVTVTEA